MAARDRDLLALRRPRSIGRFSPGRRDVAVYAFEVRTARSPIGNEQGLTPAEGNLLTQRPTARTDRHLHSDPVREELTFRGLGYRCSSLTAAGRRSSVGLLFGLRTACSSRSR
jgi:hypothetical protein